MSVTAAMGNQLEALAQVDRALSLNGRYWYTARQLHHALAQIDAAPEGSVESLLELPVDRCPRLARPPLDAPEPPPAEVFDYAVRRVLVLPTRDDVVAFAKSGFHQKIEVALVTEDWPGHVWTALAQQLDRDFGTVFYTLHDANRDGYAMASRLREQLAALGRPRVADLGLRLGPAMELGIVLKNGEPGPLPEGALEVGHEEAMMIEQGLEAELAALDPLTLMNWVYGRIARRAEDAGFG